jgi:hypothetical protein
VELFGDAGNSEYKNKKKKYIPLSSVGKKHWIFLSFI